MVYASCAVQLAVAAELMAHPTRRLPLPRGAALVGGTLGVAGAGAFAAAGDAFGSARQLSGTETGHVIDQGIYEVSRNPQYLGWLTLLAGATVASRLVDAVLGTAVTAAAFDHWIRHEEANLTELFGDEYRAYRASTARWLGPRSAVRQQVTRTQEPID
jgi:protein-S-isoprenylcysteine O-methyltransferase Ste14